MKLRNGKEYSFKPKNNEHVKDDEPMPSCIKSIVDFLKREFAIVGLELFDIEYQVIKH